MRIFYNYVLGVAIVFTVLGLVPELGRFNVMDLPGSGFALVSGQLAVGDFWVLLWSGILVGIFSMLAAVLVFDRKHL